jgi:uncharacterized SAM-binding protein YcdF (DUF218 family)
MVQRLRTAVRDLLRGAADGRVWIGFALGIAFLLGARSVVNRTSWADYVVRPLVTADTHGPADAIVVLGAGVAAPCSPNLSGLRRVLLAARLHAAKRARKVIITGGLPNYAHCAVADAMGSFAEELGIPPADIVRERASRTTWENAVYSQPILRELGARRIVVVTDRLHMPRAERCFRRLGFQVERASVPVAESHPDNVSMLLGGLREYAANAYYNLVIFRRHATR